MSGIYSILATERLDHISLCQAVAVHILMPVALTLMKSHQNFVHSAGYRSSNLISTAY